MDKIVIKDFEVFANHGVNIEENKMGQLFVVSLEMSVNLTEAATSDDLTKTIHYGDVCRDIEKEMIATNYNLIEAVSLNIIKMLFEKYLLIQSIKLTLKKPWAPIAQHLKYVAIEMERTREEMRTLGK